MFITFFRSSFSTSVESFCAFCASFFVAILRNKCVMILGNAVIYDAASVSLVLIQWDAKTQVELFIACINLVFSLVHSMIFSLLYLLE